MSSDSPGGGVDLSPEMKQLQREAGCSREYSSEWLASYPLAASGPFLRSDRVGNRTQIRYVASRIAGLYHSLFIFKEQLAYRPYCICI